jgi:hypothetical protein
LDTALVLGVVGTATGIGSLAFSVIAWSLERHDRKAEVAAERADRTAQMDMDRQRLAMEAQDRQRLLHAEITATQGGWATINDDLRNYDFVLTNLGPSWSKHVSAWLYDEHSDVDLGNGAEVGPIDVGAEKTVTLRVPIEQAERAVTPRLMVKWGDGEGPRHVEPSNLVVHLK